MCKYYIVDKKTDRYYVHPKKIFVSNRRDATELTIQKAKNILNGNFSKSEKRIMMLQIEEFNDQIPIITKSEIRNEIKRNGADEIEEVIEAVEKLCLELSKLYIPSESELETFRLNLESLLSYYDMVRSDIYHLIMVNKPQDQTRVKIYDLLQDYELKRAKTKTMLRQMQVLYNRANIFTELKEIQNRMEENKSNEYFGRTAVYDEIMKQINP